MGRQPGKRQESDVDVIAATLRLRGMAPPPAAKPDEILTEESAASDEIGANEPD